MYTPAGFCIHDVDELCDVMHQHSFATLVSCHGGGLEATQIPVLLQCDDRGEPVKLLGHMARANQHWQRAQASSVIVLFQGPHAYISPTWYEVKNAVPTWNYVTVQVSGTFHVINDSQQVLEILRATVEFYEQGMPNPWSIDLPDTGFIDQLAAGIVAFEIEIMQVEGKAKLSQNHDRERRQRVIAALLKSTNQDELAIAALMQKAIHDK